MFAERLKQLRKKYGVTQEQLASVIGVERSSIGKYEGKSRVIPSDDIKYRIAEFFNVSVDYLLGKTDTPFPAGQIELNEREIFLITNYRTLNDAGKEMVLEYVEMIATTEKYTQESALPVAR